MMELKIVVQIQDSQMKNIQLLKKGVLFFLLFFKISQVFSQVKKQGFFESISYDTIKSKSENYSVLHYHQVSKYVFENKLLKDKKDEIFTDSYNNFSRLILKGLYHTFDVPTIPLTHVYILENKKLIVGLSQFVVSPYHIVLYSMDGDLLYKSQMTLFELKIKKEEIINLLQKYPSIKDCFENNNAFKDSSYYYVELNNCLVKTIGVDSLLKMKSLVPNNFFPFLSSSTSIPYDELGRYKYKRYNNFFDLADPLDDIIFVHSLPYLLVLNDSNGNKIYIPLVSNCDILSDIKKNQ